MVCTVFQRIPMVVGARLNGEEDLDLHSSSCLVSIALRFHGDHHVRMPMDVGPRT